MSAKLKLTCADPARAGFAPALSGGVFGPCKDPCDFVMRFGGQAFQDLVDRAEHVIDYKSRTLMEEFWDKGPNTRAEAIRQTVQFFARYLEGREAHNAMDPIKRGQIFIRLAALAGLTVGEVRQFLEEAVNPLRQKRKQFEAANPFKFPMPGSARTHFEPSDASERMARLRKVALDQLDQLEGT